VATENPLRTPKVTNSAHCKELDFVALAADLPDGWGALPWSNSPAASGRAVTSGRESPQVAPAGHRPDAANRGKTLFRPRDSTEVFNALGETIAVTAVPECALGPLRQDEVLCARVLAPA
jgi:hypothetical protein